MITLIRSQKALAKTDVFQSKGLQGMVEVEAAHDWRQPARLQAVATLLTGADHGKLRESIEVVDADGNRLHYLEKL